MTNGRNDAHLQLITREASELGMQPGRFAAVVTLHGRHYEQFAVTRTDDGDIEVVHYRAVGGMFLDVFND